MNKRKILVISISSGIALLTVIALIIILIITSKTDINLNDYITISYKGYDTVGEADCDLKVKKLLQDYGTELGITNEFEQIAFEFALEEYISVKLTKDEELSNGEKISLVWKVDNNVFEEKYGCTMKFSNDTKIVSGLKELVEYDPFEKNELVIDGVSSRATAKMKRNDVESNYFDYVITPNSGLSNGDKVTVKVECNESTEDYLLRKGMKLVNREKEFTVEGLIEYVSKLDEIPQKEMDEMKKQAEDTYKAHVAENWSEAESAKAITYMGEYLLSAKSNLSYGDANNYLYLIYKIDVSNSEGDFSYYYYTCYNNLYIDNNGEFRVDIMNYKVPDGGYYYYLKKLYGEAFWHGSYYYIGYETIDALFNSCILKKLEKYSYTTNITEK